MLFPSTSRLGESAFSAAGELSLLPAYSSSHPPPPVAAAVAAALWLMWLPFPFRSYSQTVEVSVDIAELVSISGSLGQVNDMCAVFPSVCKAAGFPACNFQEYYFSGA